MLQQQCQVCLLVVENSCYSRGKAGILEIPSKRLTRQRDCNKCSMLIEKKRLGVISVINNRSAWSALAETACCYCNEFNTLFGIRQVCWIFNQHSATFTKSLAEYSDLSSILDKSLLRRSIVVNRLWKLFELSYMPESCSRSDLFTSLAITMHAFLERSACFYQSAIASIND